VTQVRLSPVLLREKAVKARVPHALCEPAPLLSSGTPGRSDYRLAFFLERFPRLRLNYLGSRLTSVSSFFDLTFSLLRPPATALLMTPGSPSTSPTRSERNSTPPPSMFLDSFTQMVFLSYSFLPSSSCTPTFAKALTAKIGEFHLEPL